MSFNREEWLKQDECVGKIPHRWGVNGTCSDSFSIHYPNLFRYQSIIGHSQFSAARQYKWRDLFWKWTLHVSNIAPCDVSIAKACNLS